MFTVTCFVICPLCDCKFSKLLYSLLHLVYTVQISTYFTIKKHLKQHKLALFLFHFGFLYLKQELCLWCLYLYCHTSVMPPCCAPPRQTCLTSAGPGFVWPDPGSIRWYGLSHHSWAGVAMDLKDLGLHAQCSGTCAQPTACHTWCACSSSVCFYPWCSWSSAMAKSCSLSKGWVRDALWGNSIWRFLLWIGVMVFYICYYLFNLLSTGKQTLAFIIIK